MAHQQQRSALCTRFADEWFNSDREPVTDRLTSAPVQVTLSLTPRLAALFGKHRIGSADVDEDDEDADDNTNTTPSPSLISVEVVYHDLKPVEVFTEDATGSPGSWAMSALPPHPFTVTSFSSSSRRLTLAVDRRLPLSSSHANRRLRLAFILGGGSDVVVSPAFIVRAKKGKRGTVAKYKFKDPFVELNVARRAALRALSAAAGAGTVDMSATTIGATVMEVRAPKPRVVRPSAAGATTAPTTKRSGARAGGRRRPNKTTRKEKDEFVVDDDEVVDEEEEDVEPRMKTRRTRRTTATSHRVMDVASADVNVESDSVPQPHQPPRLAASSSFPQLPPPTALLSSSWKPSAPNTPDTVSNEPPQSDLFSHSDDDAAADQDDSAVSSMDLFDLFLPAMADDLDDLDPVSLNRWEFPTAATNSAVTAPTPAPVKLVDLDTDGIVLPVGL